MGHVHEGPGLRRSRSRRAVFAATALLAGCATAGREAATVQAFANSARPGETGAVLFRITPPGAARPAVMGRARGWALDGSVAFGYAGDLSPSRAAREEGWILHAQLRPGTYFMRLEGVGGSQGTTPADIAFRIPPAPPTITYIGSFRVVCDAGAAPAAASPCRVETTPDDESAVAAALVAAEGSGVAPPVTSLARPYPPRLAVTGLPPPVVPEFRVDARLWLAAIDWNALTAATVPPPLPAAGEPRADAVGFADARMVATANWGDGMAGAGMILALGVGLAALIVAVPIYLIAREIQRDAEANRTAADARRQAEALRAAAQVQQRWGPCSAGIAATLAPGNVERHLRTTLASGREAGRRASLPGPWQATVTRVILRHCGASTDTYGVEVATRWTATRPGEHEPAFDAAFSRTVQGARPDPRLLHSTRPPWEVPVASEATCRPIADYCGAGGSALLLQEVIRGVTEARDAIAAGR